MELENVPNLEMTVNGVILGKGDEREGAAKDGSQSAHVEAPMAPPGGAANYKAEGLSPAVWLERWRAVR